MLQEAGSAKEEQAEGEPVVAAGGKAMPWWQVPAAWLLRPLGPPLHPGASGQAAAGGQLTDRLTRTNYRPAFSLWDRAVKNVRNGENRRKERRKYSF